MTSEIDTRDYEGKSVPNPVAYPKLTFNGRACTAYPAKPEHVLLQFEDGSKEKISLSEFRALPSDKHLIIRDEYWDHFGGHKAQDKIEEYLYGPRK